MSITTDHAQAYRWPELPATIEPQQPILIVAALPPVLATYSPSQWHTESRLFSRQILKQAIARLSNQTEAAIHLIETPRGPQLFKTANRLNLSISLSYSSQHLLIGLMQDGQIGVDICPISKLPDWQITAELYLGPVITQAILQLPPNQIPQRFAWEWARFEAQCKCTQQGIVEWSAHQEIEGLNTRRIDVGKMEVAAFCCREI